MPDKAALWLRGTSLPEHVSMAPRSRFRRGERLHMSARARR